MGIEFGGLLIQCKAKLMMARVRLHAGKRMTVTAGVTEASLG